MENSSPWWALILFLAFPGACIGLFWYVKKSRRDAMAQMAKRLGLSPWPDDSLPVDLNLRGTPLADWETRFNAYEGLIRGCQVAVFDITKGTGHGGWSRTILAVKTPEEVTKDWYGLEPQRVGAWIVFYRPVGFLRYTEFTPVGEVEKRLRALADASASCETR